MSDEPTPPHGSPLRHLMAEAQGTAYRSLDSLRAAQECPDGVVILEGDEGGQIYLVVPARQVACTEAALEDLLADLDRINWDDLSMAHLVYERSPIGSHVAGGMGGGLVTPSVWIHPEIVALGIDGPIHDVLAGAIERLPEDVRALKRR